MPEPSVPNSRKFLKTKLKTTLITRVNETLARAPLEHDPEKWEPVFGKDHAQARKHDPEKWGNRFSEKVMAQARKHDPEKWEPVFGKDHAQAGKLDLDPIRSERIKVQGRLQYRVGRLDPELVTMVVLNAGRVVLEMKLYDGGRAPNPRRVRIYLAEKGLTVPLAPVDLGALQHKSADFAAINPVQRVPALVLDDGSVITESIAICRYFEALHPEPPLFGQGARGIAEVEMWNRRLELHLLFPIAHVFRNTHPAMKDMEVPQVPAWAEANKPRIMDFLGILDRALMDRPFAAGDRFTVADITGLVAVDFLKPAKLTVPETCGNVRRWHAAISARPSASA